ncbi:MAG TPA: nitrate- and nitrite sensing domain-containing protein, partial [Pseudonocardia sp.]|nr:nitrate- and nitrite sensing domain-containing protein [Pseudonocardia sp.]
MRKDQRPPPSGRPERFAPRNWSLRTKLAIVLAVPAVLAVVLGGLRILDQASQAAELDRVSRFIDAQGEIAVLVERLQQERFQATQYVAAGRQGDVGPLELAGADVDNAGAAARPVVQALYEDDQSLVGAHRQAEQALARLPGLRNLVTTSNAPPSAVVSRYSDLIGQIVQLDDTLLRGVNTAEASGLATALAGLTLARNEASLQSSLVDVAARTDELLGSDLAELQNSQARLQQGLNDFRAALDAGQRVRYGALIAGPTNNDRTTLVNGVLAGAVSNRPGGGLDEESAATVYTAFLGELDQAEDGVRNELTGTSAAARQTAVTLAAVNGVVLLLALLIGAVVVGLIARQMISSLRTLRRGAMEVADARLPDAVARMRSGSVPDTDIEPVPVTTREEIGEVARAFDAVHAQAVRLAAEQATLQSNVNAMFVNLSRRSQTLVDRQLKLIEELEAGEEDPEQLSNLFRLDHLATRMRRNSENLLVLAGTDLAQRAVRPVPAIEVLQAAVSEVEQYRRIVVQSPPDLAIIGRVSSDLQHLLAELLENAANFSPPDSRVVMSTSRTADGALLVEIADLGVGMTPAELTQLNDQLRKSGDATVEASRRMGLFVVGRLAARHGIDVGLFAGSSVAAGGSGAGNPGSGLTARVWVPRHLIAERSASQQQQPQQQSGLPQRVGGPREDQPSQPPFSWSGNPERRTGPVPLPGGSPQPPQGPRSVPQPGRSGAPPVRGPRPVPARGAQAPPFHGFGEPEARPRPTQRPQPPEPAPPAEDRPGADRAPAVHELPGRDRRVDDQPSTRDLPARDLPFREVPEHEVPEHEVPEHEVLEHEVPAQRSAPPSRPTGASAARPPVPVAVPVELPVADGEPGGLFAAATPAPPLPDPFAAERPRDPFAAEPEPEPEPPAFTELGSGWFRAQPPAEDDRGLR